jgi:hypothetical protein
MYQLRIYAIALNLWRWEVRLGGNLLRCGTAATRSAATRNANAVVDA